MAAIVRRLGRRAAKHDFSTFFLRKIDIELYLIELRFRNHRALIGFLIQRITDSELRRFVDETFDKMFIG